MTRTPCAPPPVAPTISQRCLGRAGVHRDLGARRLGERKLVGRDVERRDAQPHRLGVLDREMAEAADAGDRDPFARLRLGFPQSLVGRHAGAQDRGDLRVIRRFLATWRRTSRWR